MKYKQLATGKNDLLAVTGFEFFLLFAVPFCLAYAAFAGFQMKTKAGSLLGLFAVLGLATLGGLVWFASTIG